VLPQGASDDPRSAQTIQAIQRAFSKGVVPADLPLAKATTQGISTATGLVGINLEAPAKNLFPVLSPLRNRFPRKGAATGSTAVQWRAITGINTTAIKAGVAEGNRNSVVSTAEVDHSQAYKTFGLDDFVTFDAVDAAAGFMDIRAEATANLLAATMVEEEKIILGGNVQAIGKPAAMTTPYGAADSSAAGPFTASTAYDFAVSALTSYGYLNAATGRTGGVDASDETDGRTLTTFTTGSGKTSVVLSWGAVRGAVAYNVFIGTHSGTLYYAFTTAQTSIIIDSTVLAALPGSGHTPNLADQTADALSYDGLIPQIEASAISQYTGNGAYFHDMQGAQLSSDNANGVPEIDAMLRYLWDHWRIGPTALIVNAQEAQNIATAIVQGGNAAGTTRWVQQVNADGTVTGGLVADSYRNKFTAPRIIPIEIHPYLAPGTIIAISERLPFPRTNVPNPFEIDMRREYTQYDWAQVARKFEFGVYAAGCLKAYFPAGCGTIVGIRDGVAS
jgi:hypothetical protein